MHYALLSRSFQTLSTTTLTFQAFHGQQAMESSWRKSACRIPAHWKFHRTYRKQFMPKHQQCLQQATSSWSHYDQQFKCDWHRVSKCWTQGKKHRHQSQPKVHWMSWNGWTKAPEKESGLLSLWDVSVAIWGNSQKHLKSFLKLINSPKGSDQSGHKSTQVTTQTLT